MATPDRDFSPAYRALARAVEGGPVPRHAERVSRLAFAVATELRWAPGRAHELAEAAYFHDVGKIVVPSEILEKPGALTTREFEIVKRHAVVGARLVASVLTPEQTGWILHHHERLDGHGYPDHATSRRIPGGARIIGVADAFVVMTTGRNYQQAESSPIALSECDRRAGTQFDREVVEALRRVVERTSMADLPPRVTPSPALHRSIAA